MNTERQFLSELHKTFTLTGSFSDTKIGAPDSKTALETALAEDSTRDETRGAIIYLFLVKPEESLKNAGKILRTASFSKLREFVVELLVNFGTRQHLDAMILLLRRGSIMDRKRLLMALLDMGEADNPKVLNLIRRYLQYGDQHSRVIAIQAVERIGTADFTEELLYLLQKETAEPVRSAVLKALRTNRDSAVIELLKFVAENDGSPSLRNEARAIASSLVSGAA